MTQGHGACRSSGGAEGLVRNEFAAVRVEIDHSALSPRLKIQDLQSGASIFLDALELAGLAASTHARLRFLHDPSLSHWRSAEAGSGRQDEDEP